MQIVLATRNRGKIREIKYILSDLPIEIKSLLDFPNIPEIEEKGNTFEENALIKAKTVAKLTGLPALADDSGLAVDCLNGAPGVYSARYAGEGADDKKNNEKLLRELEGIPLERRGAAFVCVIALCIPKGNCYIEEGKCKGVISLSPRGSYGFGYDPIFFLPDYGKTMAELPLEVKNQISHRYKALKKIKSLIRNLFIDAGKGF
ncbi:MAG: XTP/dITP diphosphatase [Deltaproteobacteria bacterium]|nr:XTP/dITP diphosphatase [Deltaproteobacteria bacterium]